MFSTIGHLSGVAVTSTRLATGDEDVEASDVIDKVASLTIDPLQELSNPFVESILEDIKSYATGQEFEYKSSKGLKYLETLTLCYLQRSKKTMQKLLCLYYVS